MQTQSLTSLPYQAQTALDSANWNLQEAVALYFAAQEGLQGSKDDDFDPEADLPDLPAPTPAQPTTAAASSSSSSSRKATNQRPKQMTLDDIKKRDEEDDSEDEEDKKQNMFAGGEKSGLAVKNPGQGGGPTDHFKNIMNQARQSRERPPAAGEEPAEVPARSSAFTGRAQTLGGDDAPSQVVEDPQASSRSGRQATTRVNRTLHVWADGISIDDGPLFRFDDPANQSIMAEINRGRAPLALLDVQPDQEVDLTVDPHKDENYKAPAKKFKPFSGGGQRLGSPTPGSSTSGTATTAPAPSQPTSAASTADTSAPQIDSNAPTVQLQIRLGDGTRLQSRFNTTHTVGDVYAFVDRSSAASTQRPYALMTTFPSKELDDRAVVLGDMADFRRGGVVVQKWK